MKILSTLLISADYSNRTLFLTDGSNTVWENTKAKRIFII